MKRKIYLVLLCVLFSSVLVFGQTKFTLSGYVTDQNGESLIGASIVVSELLKGTVTNSYGFYSITLDKGLYNFEINYMGYEAQTININLNENLKKSFKLKESVEYIESVDVIAQAPDRNIQRAEMSTNKLQMKTVQKLPVIFGEGDIIKTIQLLPGVLMSNEASGGFHVRGGNVDQNLVLLDHAPVYNASHAVGFFSVFNSNAINDVKLYKGGIPSEYGGRLSSVLDIKLKEGNTNEYHGEAGIGIISSKINVEGPVVRDKGSFIVSGRRTYIDLFMPFINDSLVKESDVFFYDLNAKINYKINDNNRLFLSGYFGRDVLKISDLIGQKYGNATATLRWNHLFNSKLFLNSTSIFSNYNYVFDVTEELNQINWKTSIQDYNLKTDLTYYLNLSNTVKFGIQAIRHDFNPGTISGKVGTANVSYDIQNAISYEWAAYMQNEQDISPKIKFIYGLRYSVFHNVGEGKYFEFDKTNPDNYVVSDTLNIKKGKIYNTYPWGFEPRISMRYLFNDETSVKLSYNRMIQYIQLASNSASSMPIDYWFPASPNIKPQIADQIAAGLFRNFNNNIYEASIEVFYKNVTNSIDFKDHANLILNDEFEGQVRMGKSWAYGAEFYIGKQIGNLTGWISYTYSRAFKKINEVNKGKSYAAAYDKPHDISVVLSYDVNERLNISGNFVYTSPQARTMPEQRFSYDGMIAPVYGERNTVRVFPYHRADLSMNLRLNKVKHSWEHSINVSIYNIYGRNNPLMVSFEQDDDDPLKTVAKTQSLYAVPIPSISYSIKF